MMTLFFFFFGCNIPLKWLLLFLSVQENYFGEDDMYTDFEESLSSPVLSSCSSSSGWTGVGLEENRSKDTPHPLSLRPWDITVLINLHKVHGRLPTVSTASVISFIGAKVMTLLN